MDAYQSLDKYKTETGKWDLLIQTFGDQLQVPAHSLPLDVKQRLDWYKQHAASRYERSVKGDMNVRSIQSPIEQIFLMEWRFLEVDARYGVTLRPKHELSLRVARFGLISSSIFGTAGRSLSNSTDTIFTSGRRLKRRRIWRANGQSSGMATGSGRRTLSKCGCRKADTNKNEQRPHRTHRLASRLPNHWRLIKKISRRAFALCGPRRRVLKIDCLLNDPTPVVYKLAPSGSECEAQNCAPSNETNEMLQGEHGAVRRVVSLQLQPWIFSQQIFS